MQHADPSVHRQAISLYLETPDVCPDGQGVCESPYPDLPASRSRSSGRDVDDLAVFSDSSSSIPRQRSPRHALPTRSQQLFDAMASAYSTCSHSAPPVTRSSYRNPNGGPATYQGSVTPSKLLCWRVCTIRPLVISGGEKIVESWSQADV